MLTTQAASGPADSTLYVPEPATLTKVEKVTEHEMLFEVELEGGRPLGGDRRVGKDDGDRAILFEDKDGFRGGGSGDQEAGGQSAGDELRHGVALLKLLASGQSASVGTGRTQSP